MMELVSLALTTIGDESVSYFKRHPKDKAFSIYMEFGPELRIPREVRLRQCFPRIDGATISGWIEEFKRFDSLIWKVAEAGASSAYSSEEMTNIFREHFPDYGGSSLRLASARADYYAWHEGFGL
jgi:hypothetical protein